MNKDIEYIDIPNIKLITKKSDNELLVYAYDDEGGFYFATYDFASNEMQDPTYTDMKIKEISSIAYDTVLDKVICLDSKGVFAPDNANIAQQAYFYEKSGSLYSGNCLQYVDGYTYCFLNYDGENKIVRLYNAAYIKDNPVLKSYVLGSYVPEGYGYQIESKQLNYTEMATVLLAGDSDYDFLILSSNDQLARRMRDIKAYENLNDIEGIKNLLDGCFNYISDAAIDSSGNIWMLPIAVECPLLIYNPDNCEKNGIEINNKYTYDKLIKDIGALQNDESVVYNIPYYYMTNDIINKYVLDYAIKDNKSIFDTDVFKKYVEIIKRV